MNHKKELLWSLWVGMQVSKISRMSHHFSQESTTVSLEASLRPCGTASPTTSQPTEGPDPKAGNECYCMFPF